MVASNLAHQFSRITSFLRCCATLLVARLCRISAGHKALLTPLACWRNTCNFLLSPLFPTLATPLPIFALLTFLSCVRLGRTLMHSIMIAHPLATLKCRHKDGALQCSARNTPHHPTTLPHITFMYTCGHQCSTTQSLSPLPLPPPAASVSSFIYPIRAFQPHTIGHNRQKPCDPPHNAYPGIPTAFIHHPTS